VWLVVLGGAVNPEERNVDGVDQWFYDWVSSPNISITVKTDVGTTRTNQSAQCNSVGNTHPILVRVTNLRTKPTINIVVYEIHG
jgi:hypothetical protein